MVGYALMSGLVKLQIVNTEQGGVEFEYDGDDDDDNDNSGRDQ